MSPSSAVLTARRAFAFQPNRSKSIATAESSTVLATLVLVPRNSRGPGYRAEVSSDRGLRDRRTAARRRDDRERSRYSGAAAASEVLRAGSMAEDERSCYDSAAKRADRRGGAALVRGARDRTEGIQDQEAVDFT